MVKTVFEERFDKAVKFYDYTYHMHKATFRGLSNFYRLYSNIEKDYSDGIMALTKSVWNDMPELKN